MQREWQKEESRTRKTWLYGVLKDVKDRKYFRENTEEERGGDGKC